LPRTSPDEILRISQGKIGKSSLDLPNDPCGANFASPACGGQAKFGINVVLIVLLFSFMGCGQRAVTEHIDFEDTVELKQIRTPQGLSLNVCVGSMITPEEGYEYYKRLLDYIGRKLAMRINFIDREGYAEVNSLLKKGSIDMAFICGGPYVDGHDEFGLELLVVPQIDGKVVYYSYIIVGKDSKIESLEGLRGKTFAFVDPMSNTGRLMPTYILQEELHEKPENFFKECLYTYAHDKSIKAVAHGIVDGAAVDSVIWEYMNKKSDKHTKETRIIKISSPCGMPPVVVRPSLDTTLKMKIKSVLLNMHKENDGREILEGMFMDKFVEVGDSNYDNIRKIKASIAN